MIDLDVFQSGFIVPEQIFSIQFGDQISVLLLKNVLSTKFYLLR